MEAVAILRQEHHSFAYPSSIFYILLCTGTINTHNSDSSQSICQAARWECTTAQDGEAPVRNQSSGIWRAVMHRTGEEVNARHRTGEEVNARQSATGSVCANTRMKMQLLLRQDNMETVRRFKLWDTWTEDSTRFLNSIFYNPTPFHSHLSTSMLSRRFIGFMKSTSKHLVYQRRSALHWLPVTVRHLLRKLTVKKTTLWTHKLFLWTGNVGYFALCFRCQYILILNF